MKRSFERSAKTCPFYYASFVFEIYRLHRLFDRDEIFHEITLYLSLERKKSTEMFVVSVAEIEEKGIGRSQPASNR